MTAKRFGVLLKQGNAQTGGTLAAGLCHCTESRCLAQWKWAHGVPGELQPQKAARGWKEANSCVLVPRSHRPPGAPPEVTPLRGPSQAGHSAQRAFALLPLGALLSLNGEAQGGTLGQGAQQAKGQEGRHFHWRPGPGAGSLSPTQVGLAGKDL